MNTEQRISKARTHLLLDHPWFGTLALRLKMEAGGETISTDGSVLHYNKDWVGKLTDAELIGVMAHEVMHCALLHVFRGSNRKWNKWNEACDLVINPLLTAEGFSLPAGAMLDQQYIGMTAEQVYALRKQQEQDDPQGSGQGQGDSSATGDFQPAPKGTEPDEGNEPSEAQGMSETDWQVAAEQASAVTKRFGSMGADTERALKAARQASSDWRAILREFVEQALPSDYSWSSPNRRYVGSGLYLPGVIKENLPKIGIAVDTSGSVSQAMLKQFSAEITAILHEARPESLQVVYCNTTVVGEEEFSPEDTEVILHARGGGGTAFQPALDRFNEDPPICVIYLTDLEGPAPIQPEYPVLWAVPEFCRMQPSFGQLVRYSAYA